MTAFEYGGVGAPGSCGMTLMRVWSLLCAYTPSANPPAPVAASNMPIAIIRRIVCLVVICSSQ